MKGSGGARSAQQETFARLVTQGGCVYALVAYDDGRSTSDNVAAGVRVVEAAIAERRRRTA